MSERICLILHLTGTRFFPYFVFLTRRLYETPICISVRDVRAGVRHEFDYVLFLIFGIPVVDTVRGCTITRLMPPSIHSQGLDRAKRRNSEEPTSGSQQTIASTHVEKIQTTKSTIYFPKTVKKPQLQSVSNLFQELFEQGLAAPMTPNGLDSRKKKSIDWRARTTPMQSTNERKKEESACLQVFLHNAGVSRVSLGVGWWLVGFGACRTCRT